MDPQQAKGVTGKAGAAGQPKSAAVPVKRSVGGTAKPIATRPGSGVPKKVGGTAKPVATRPAVVASTEPAQRKPSDAPAPRDEPIESHSPAPSHEGRAEKRGKPRQGTRIRPAHGPAKGGSKWLLPVLLLLIIVGGVCGWLVFNATPTDGSSSDRAEAGGVGGSGDAASAADDSPGVETAKIVKEPFLSPYAVVGSPDGKTLYVSNHTALELAIVDADAGQVTKRVDLKERPAQLAVSPDGSCVYVACASPEGKVAFVDPGKGEITATVAVGHTPTALALTKDGKRLYCCNRFSGTVSEIDVDARKEVRSIPVAREPIAAVVAADGKILLVAHHLPLGPATGDYVGSAVSAIDLASGSASLIKLPNGTTGVRAICLSPDGAYAYVTHILAHYQLPTTQLERGWMNTNALSIIKVADRSLLNTVLLDDVDLGAANPWGVACSPEGKWLLVTHAGTQELSVIDRAALHERLEQVASGKKVATSSSAEDVPLDLAFLVGLRRRIHLEGNGPRGLTVIGSKAYVAEYFSDALGVVDLSKDVPSVQSIKLGGAAEVSMVRRGEMLFNDATACFQNWQSCASCHPDTRSDGLNWDLLNDGIGNPKNTRSLVLSHKTPPVMSLAVRDKAEVAVRAGFKHIQFALRAEEDLNAVDEYLKSLLPTPSPALVKGKLSPTALRGRQVFVKADCKSCHTPPYFTSLGAYQVGLGTGQDTEKPFDTPTLIECWRTGPYLFDGRAATLEEVFTQWNMQDKHGKTTKLTPDEIRDLVEYIRSL